MAFKPNIEHQLEASLKNDTLYCGSTEPSKLDIIAEAVRQGIKAALAEEATKTVQGQPAHDEDTRLHVTTTRSTDSRVVYGFVEFEARESEETK